MEICLRGHANGVSIQFNLPCATGDALLIVLSFLACLERFVWSVGPKPSHDERGWLFATQSV